MIGSLFHALIGDQMTSLALAAVSTYTSVHSIAILGPVLVLLGAKGGGSWRRHLALFGVVMAALLGGSALMVGSWQFLRASLGSRYWDAALVVDTADRSRGLAGPRQTCLFQPKAQFGALLVLVHRDV